MSSVPTLEVRRPTGEQSSHPDTDEALGNLAIHLADISHGVAANARDHAAEYVNERTTEGSNKLTRFVKKIWYGNVIKDVVTQRAQHQGREEIIRTGNMYALQGGSQEDHNRAAGAVVRRVADGFIHEGEEQQALMNMNQGSELGVALRELVVQYAEGAIDEAELNQQKSQLVAEFGQVQREEDRNKGLLFADNIIEVARNAKAAFDHGVGLDRIYAAVTADHTEAKTGVRTEAHLSAVDKATNWLYKTKVGSWINESTLGVVVASAMTVGSFVTKKATTAAAAVATMGAGAGLIAGVREHLHIKQDRQTHAREMAEGGQASTLRGKRRESLEATRYETVAASELLAGLGTGIESAANSPDALRAAVEAITRTQTRIDLSDERSDDFIQFSNKFSVEEERMELDMRLAEARAAVDRALASADDATLQAAGLGSRDVSTIVNERSAAALELLNGDMSAKDRAFRKLKLKRVAGMAAVGFVTGETIGLAIQEAKAAVDGDLQGLFESQDGNDRRTLLRSAVEGISGGSEPEAVSDVPVVFDHHMGMPEGYHFNQVDGKWQLLDAKGGVVNDDVTFDADGHISQASKDALTQKGFSFHDGELPADKQQPPTVLQRTPEDYIGAHPDQFKAININDWYGNGTPQFDRNELGLWWGGAGNNGIDASGNYVFDVSHMTADGSWGITGSANAQQLMQSGELSIALSMNDGTQDRVIMIPVNAQGQAIIDKESFAGKSLFRNENGEAQFIGHQAKVAQLGAIGPDGRQSVNILATHIGENSVSAVEDTIAADNSIDVLVPPAVSSETLPTEIPGVLPIAARGGLEKVTPGPRSARRTEQAAEPGYNPYGNYIGGMITPEWGRQMIADRIPELRRDPNARISLREGLQWHHNLTRRKDPEYADYIEGLVGTMPNLANLDANTDTIVPILVGANFEHDNIYRTLSLYDQMPDDWKEKTQLVLHVNWIDSKENDPVEKAKIDKTRSEVLRAIRDFPGLNISQFESIWSQEKIDKGEYGDRLIAHAAQQLVDVSMAAAYQGMQDGRIPEDHDILLWKGDADARGMGRFAGPKMTREFKDHPEADAFSGGVRWGTETYKELPGLGFVLNFMEVYRIAAQRAHIKGFQSTFGVNGGARMSTFAGIGGIGHYTNQKQSPPDDGWGDRMFAARNPNLNGTASTYGASGTQTGANNEYHRHVGGASIDTDASRFEKVYRNNEPITSIWGNVNSNGYQGRTAGLQAGQNNDDVRNRPDEVVDRIEYQMSDLISHWTAEPAQVSTALAIMLPGAADLGGSPAYTITRDANGKAEFSLTSQGKKWLINRLQFNSKGQYDPFGDRQARQLYGTTVTRGSAGRQWSIPSKQRLSRMVAGRV